MVCKLNKTLYGTKQASHEWYHHINTFITDVLLYIPCINDPCLYHRRSKSNRLMLCGLFVDDIVSAFSIYDIDEWLELKSILMKKYEMKDLDDASVVVGMRIIRDRPHRLMTIDQEVHINNMLKEHQMIQCSSNHIPINSGVPFTNEDCPRHDQDESYIQWEKHQVTVPLC